VAQHGAGSAGEHGSHPAAVAGEQPDPVDPTIDRAQPTEIDSVRDRPALEAKL
jgi:hypothetical protein